MTKKLIKNGLGSKMGVFGQFFENNSDQSEYFFKCFFSWIRFFNTDLLVYILWYCETNFFLALQGAPLIFRSLVAYIDDLRSCLKFKHIICVPNQTNKLTGKKNKWFLQFTGGIGAPYSTTTVCMVIFQNIYSLTKNFLI